MKVYKLKICVNCIKTYTPTNGRQKACASCKSLVDFERRKLWVSQNKHLVSKSLAKYRMRNREKLRERDVIAGKSERRKLQKLLAGKRWRLKNVEKHRLKNKLWRQNNKEKVNFLNRLREDLERGAQGKFTYAEWICLKKQFNHTCPACLRSEPHITLTRDHIVPISLGGLNIISNIQPLCGQCNSKKHTKEVRYAPSIF